MSVNEKCHVCGGDARAIRELADVYIGRKLVVVESERMRCSTCSAQFYLPGQMQAEQRAAVAKVRAAANLLDQQEIIAIRKRLGLTQSEMERLLGVGPKTVVRWERGTVFQNSATDKLLRIVGNVLGAAEYLAQLHEVHIKRATERPAVAEPVRTTATIALTLDKEKLPSTYQRKDILPLEDYRRRKADMKRVPADLLNQAEL